MPAITENAFIPTPQGAAEAAQANQQVQLNNFKLFGQMQLGKTASQNLNPDGSLNTSGFLTAVGQNPMLRPFVGDAYDLAQKGIQTTSQGQALVQAQNERLRGAVAAIDLHDPNASQKAIDAVNRQVASGAVSPNVASAFVGNGQWKDLIGQSTEQSGSPAELTQNIGQLGTQDVGGQVVGTLGTVGQTGATFGALPGGISKTISPEVASQTRTFAGPNGEQYAVALGDLMDPNNPGHYKRNFTAADGTQLTDANGVLRPGLSPSGTVSEQESGRVAADQQNTLLGDTTANGQRIATIEALRQDLAEVDQGTLLKSGPGSEFMSHIGSVLHMLGMPDDQVEALTKSGDIAAAQKAIVTLAAQQGAAMGMSNTDMQSEKASLMTPTLLTTPEGRAKMFSIIEGNEAQQHARIAAWQQQSAKLTADQKTAGWQTFQAQFGQRLPAQIFQWKYMTPEDQKALQAQLERSGRWTNFKKNLDAVQKNGWLP